MTACEGHILPLTKSMPIKTSEKVKASRKSHTVLSCWTSRLTLKKVKSDCFRRSLPIRTSENINAEDNISSILSSENVRAEPRKGHGAFKLDFWKTARFRHGLPTDF